MVCGGARWCVAVRRCGGAAVRLSRRPTRWSGLAYVAAAAGALYHAYGLLPGVICHYTYDVVWMVSAAARGPPCRAPADAPPPPRPSCPRP